MTNYQPENPQFQATLPNADVLPVTDFHRPDTTREVSKLKLPVATKGHSSEKSAIYITENLRVEHVG